jgi:hypothetical protein
MKAEKITVGGRDYYLAFNGSAKFSLDELCGEKSIVELTQPNTKEAQDFLFRAVSILAEQGELVRRRYGYDKGEMLQAEDLPLLLTPVEILELKTALYHAVARGYGREVQDDAKEVDLVLQELEKKTGNH